MLQTCIDHSNTKKVQQHKSNLSVTRFLFKLKLDRFTLNVKIIVGIESTLAAGRQPPLHKSALKRNFQRKEVCEL